MFEKVKPSKVKEMPFVIHTEYELEGFCKGKDSISLLRDTMFCPTVRVSYPSCSVSRSAVDIVESPVF